MIKKTIPEWAKVIGYSERHIRKRISENNVGPVGEIKPVGARNIAKLYSEESIRNLGYKPLYAVSDKLKYVEKINKRKEVSRFDKKYKLSKGKVVTITEFSDNNGYWRQDVNNNIRAYNLKNVGKRMVGKRYAKTYYEKDLKRISRKRKKEIEGDFPIKVTKKITFITEWLKLSNLSKYE